MAEDIGGILEAFLFLLQLFLLPIANYSFNLKAVKELFLIRTADTKLLSKKHTMKLKNEKRMLQPYVHFRFTLNVFEKLKLFLMLNMKCCQKHYNSKNKKLMKVYSKGVQQV